MRADAAELPGLRRDVQSLRHPGQRRVHFAKESDPRRRAILSALVRLNVRVRVYESGGRDIPARADCLRRLVNDMVGAGAERLVLETLETQEAADRRMIYEQLRRSGGSLAYEHRRAHEEPMLWVADAAAWCYGAGGDWRRRIKPILD